VRCAAEQPLFVRRSSALHRHSCNAACAAAHLSAGCPHSWDVSLSTQQRNWLQVKQQAVGDVAQEVGGLLLVLLGDVLQHQRPHPQQVADRLPCSTQRPLIDWLCGSAALAQLPCGCSSRHAAQRGEHDAWCMPACSWRGVRPESVNADRVNVCKAGRHAATGHRAVSLDAPCM
jgi:hypothetical protein